MPVHHRPGARSHRPHTPLLATLIASSVAGCVAPTVQAPPAAPRPVTVAPPPPVQPALGPDWRDWPLTPGTWRYTPAGPGGVTMATFGTAQDLPRLRLSCERGARQIAITLPGVTGTANLEVRTTSTSRTIAATARNSPDEWPPVSLEVRLSATDPLLDAMAFSRGRFTIGQPGRPPLVIPAYAEIGRVIEDCRG
ncbi:hypothetical protein QE361_001694 [Sphingomonas sp. SORGH_AS802]|uniref:hypothetical protein n=1 Tax=unclassified Sphingomonas TaxID=196159 RepID=UPI002859B2E1|nr:MULTISPECIES: hypothetical protein [unclassified Sphingomonas]MDR6126927.1 hypothetical protein [Sphingomonas sp. SORGH_AS_0438]MDR6134711.1 hypothetical protein [Sphingomonas sp. SORGH_AS_0802]